MQSGRDRGRCAASTSTCLLFSCHNTHGVPVDQHLGVVYIGASTKDTQEQLGTVLLITTCYYEAGGLGYMKAVLCHKPALHKTC